ncbi:unnamed protein product, partial [Iphiclides podalirius]
MGGGSHLPSGEPPAPLPPSHIKKKHFYRKRTVKRTYPRRCESLSPERKCAAGGCARATAARQVTPYCFPHNGRRGFPALQLNDKNESVRINGGFSTFK